MDKLNTINIVCLNEGSINFDISEFAEYHKGVHQAEIHRSYL